MANTILLIESKQCDREILPILLKRVGFQTIVAENLNEAYILLGRSNPPDVDMIFLSSETVDKDYLNFMIWAKKYHPKVKIVVASCRPMDQKACEEFEALFIQKPITDIRILGQMLKI